MTNWSAVRARQVLTALQKIGWRIARQRQRGSHRVLAKEGRPNVVFAFHDAEEIGPRMLARIAKHSDLHPEDLWKMVIVRQLDPRAVQPDGAVRGQGRDPDHIADPRLVLRNNCGHWPPFEKPAEWTAQALALLKGY